MAAPWQNMKNSSGSEYFYSALKRYSPCHVACKQANERNACGCVHCMSFLTQCQRLRGCLWELSWQVEAETLILDSPANQRVGFNVWVWSDNTAGLQYILTSTLGTETEQDIGRKATDKIISAWLQREPNLQDIMKTLTLLSICALLSVCWSMGGKKKTFASNVVDLSGVCVCVCVDNVNDLQWFDILFCPVQQ